MKYAIKAHLGPEVSHWQWIADAAYRHDCCESLEDAALYDTIDEAHYEAPVKVNYVIWEIQLTTEPHWFEVPRARYRRRWQQRFIFSRKWNTLVCGLALGESLDCMWTRVMLREVGDSGR